jgi:hypothetical protein
VSPAPPWRRRSSSPVPIGAMRVLPARRRRINWRAALIVLALGLAAAALLKGLG